MTQNKPPNPIRECQCDNDVDVFRWVGYDEDGFEGEQFVLEEGEYLDWRDWGGMGQNLRSLRPVLTVSLHKTSGVLHSVFMFCDVTIAGNSCIRTSARSFAKIYKSFLI